MERKSNIAYIDGQNLRMGTLDTKPSWRIDLQRFRVYLREKYHVDKAFYYMGYVIDGDKYQRLYEHIQESGFILVFREHNSAMIGKKKGNVDSDMILDAMKRLYLKEKFDQIVLVSGDGDYKGLVDFLIEKKQIWQGTISKQKVRVFAVQATRAKVLWLSEQPGSPAESRAQKKKVLLR